MNIGKRKSVATYKKLNKHAKYMLITHHQRKYILLCESWYTFFFIHSWMPPLSLSKNNNEGHISLKLLPEFYRYTAHFFLCDRKIYIFIRDVAKAFEIWNEHGKQIAVISVFIKFVQNYYVIILIVYSLGTWWNIM